MITFFGGSQFFKFVSFLLCLTDVQRSKCTTLGVLHYDCFFNIVDLNISYLITLLPKYNIIEAGSDSTDSKL